MVEKAPEGEFGAGGGGAHGWLSQLSVRLWLTSRFMGSSPPSGSELTARSLEPALDSVSPSFSAPHLLMLCVSLSKMNKRFLKKKKKALEFPKSILANLLALLSAVTMICWKPQRIVSLSCLVSYGCPC